MWAIFFGNWAQPAVPRRWYGRRSEGLFPDGHVARGALFRYCYGASAGYLWKSTVDKGCCFWYIEDRANNTVGPACSLGDVESKEV